MTKAIDVIISELDKLAMCKRGILATEGNKRSSELRKQRDLPKEPRLSLAKRGKAYAANRAALLAILEYKPPSELCHLKPNNGYTGDVFTPESKRAYQVAVQEALKHPDYDSYCEAKRKLSVRLDNLQLEMKQRGSMLDEAIKEAKMDFISETVSLQDYREVLDNLESQEF